MGYYWLILFLHVLGATIWTGGHLALTFIVLPQALRGRDPRVLLDFEQGFERIGMPALFIQVATGLWMAWQFSPGLATWLSFDDPMTIGIGVKLGLLFGHRRFRVKRSLSGDPTSKRRNPAANGMAHTGGDGDVRAFRGGGRVYPYGWVLAGLHRPCGVKVC